MKRFKIIFILVFFAFAFSLQAQNITGFGLLGEQSSINPNVSLVDNYYEFSATSSYAVPPSDPNTLMYMLWGKTYSTAMQLPYSIAADIYIVGVNEAKIAWSVDDGSLFRNTHITTLSPNSDFETEIFPLVSVGNGPGQWQNLRIAISLPSNEFGLLTVRIRNIRALDQFGSLLYTIDDPSGGSGTIPSIPTLGTPADGATVTIPQTFTWGAVTDAASYTFQMSSQSNFSSLLVNQVVTTNSYTVSSLSAGTYYWRVRANGTGGSSIFTTERTVIFNSGTTAGPVLTLPENAASTGTGVTFLWNPVQNAASYRIQISETSDFLSPIVDQSGTILNSFYTNLSANTQYYWRVNAVIGGITTSWSELRNFYTGNNGGGGNIPIPTLEFPIDGIIVSPSPTLGWTSSPGIGIYELQISRNGGFESIAYWTTTYASGITVTVIALESDILYYWRVRKWIDGIGGNWSIVGYFIVSALTNSEFIGDNKTPTEFSLLQNYPNPFNPTTTIRFAVPKATPVSMKIYNTLGQEVAELVNETKSAGEYEVNFNASNLPSGIYFYRLQAAGSFIETKSMVLMK